MNPGFGPEMFPLYEGVDAEYVAGAPDVSYPVEYGYANFGDDLDDDTLSDIYIEDEAYPDEDYYVNDFENEPWLPYSPSKDAGSGGAQQQIVLGGGIPIHPPTGELTESYCRFYPGECSGKVNVLPQVNSTCIAGANGSDPNCMAAEGTDRGLYPALNSVDLSGVGMVLLIALLLLIGVHFGWDSDKGKQAKGPGEERPRQTKRGSPERPSEQGDRQDRPGPGDAPQPRKNDRQEGGPRRPKDPAAAPLPPDRPPADSRKGEGGEGASSLTPTEKEKQKAQAALEKAKKEQKRARESGDAEAIRRADEKVKKAEEKLRRATAADNRARGNGNPGDARQRDDKRDGHERPPRTTPASEETGRRDRTDGSGHPKRSSETPGSDPDPRSRRRERDKGDGQPSGPAQPADTPRSKTRTPSQQAADDAVTAAEKNLKAAKEAERRAIAKAIQDEQERTGVKPKSTPKTPEVEAARKRRKEAEEALKKAKQSQQTANEEAQSGSGGKGGGGGQSAAKKGSGRGSDHPSRLGDDNGPEKPRNDPAKSRQPSRPASEPSGGTHRDARAPRTEPSKPAAPKGTPKNTSPSDGSPSGPTAAQKAADKAVTKATERLKRTQEAETSAKASGDKNAAERARRGRKAAETDLAKAQADKGLADAKATVEAAQKDLERAKSAERATPEGSEARENARGERKEAERKLQDAKQKQERAQAKRDVLDAGKTERQKKADRKVAAAQAELEEAQQAVKEAKASKDTKKEREAKERYEKARGDYDKAKKEKEDADREAGKSRAQGGDARSTDSGSLTPMKMLPIFLLLIALIGLLGRGNLVKPTRHVADPIFRPPSMAVPKASARSWTASSKPPSHISINNVHAQGSDIPINIGTSEPEPVVVVADPGPPIVEHYEPLEFHFTGPASPDRVVGMLIGLAVASGPLILDWARDWPDRPSFWTEYISAMYHWLVLGLFIMTALLAAGRRYDMSAQYGYKLASGVRGVGDMLGPAVVATVETSEHLVWGAEDLVFGDSRHALGAVVAVGLVVGSTMREPIWEGEQSDYASPAVQFMYLVGLFLVGVILWNA